MTGRSGSTSSPRRPWRRLRHNRSRYQVGEVDHRHLADLCLRHHSKQYYNVCERLAKQLQLSEQDHLRVRRLLKEALKHDQTYYSQEGKEK